jgi:hypothetical protein
MTNLDYIVYLVASIAMTVWVSHTLSRTGEIFLVRCFGGDEALARSTNHLLVVGFYLVNLGFIGLRMSGWSPNPGPLVPFVGSKIGVTMLVLGAMHFFNMLLLVLFRLVGGRMGTRAAVPPPLPR